MCELNLVKVQCVTVKLLTILSNNNEVDYFYNKKYVKAIIFKISVVVNQQEIIDVWTKLGDTTVCYCEFIEYFISNIFRTLQTVS